MGRKRSPEHDWICRRCGCPCESPNAEKQKHIGGGQGLRACKRTPDPVLRSEMEAEAAAVVASIRQRSQS